jgi:hypothetical protein
MRNIYTYLTILLLTFLSGSAVFAQCGNMRIIVNVNGTPTTFATAVNSPRDTLNMTITQGEAVSITHASIAFANYVWNAGYGGSTDNLVSGVTVVDGASITIPTTVLTPCSTPYGIDLNLGSIAGSCQSNATVRGIRINLTVVSAVTANTVRMVAGAVSLGTTSCLTLGTTPTAAGTTYNWSFNSTTSTASALPPMNLPIGTYPGTVTITNPGACGVETLTFNVNIVQSAISMTGMPPATGTTATPSSHSITVTQGNAITMTNASVASATQTYQWYAGTTTGAAHNLTAGGPVAVSAGGVFSISTTGLSLCDNTITVTMVANGDISCNQGNMQHLVLNAYVQRPITVNGNLVVTDTIAVGQGGVNVSTPVTTSTTYLWNINNTTYSTAALPTLSLAANLYPVTLTTSSLACPSQTNVFWIRVQDACGIRVNNTTNYFGSIASPAPVNLTINRGDTLRFSQQGNSTDWSWLSAINSGAVSVIGTNTGSIYELNTAALVPCSYILTVSLGSTNGSCASPYQAALRINLTVKTRLTLNGNTLGATASICQAVPISLAAGAAMGYNWSFASTTSMASMMDTITGLSAGTAYPGTVILSHPTCTSATTETMSFVINVQDNIDLTVNNTIVQNGLISVCQGLPIVLAVGSGVTPLSYAWNLSGTTGTASTFTATGLPPGAYAARVTLTTNPSACFAGTVVERSFTINVESNPTGIIFTSTRLSAPITAGDTVRLCPNNRTTIVANCPGGTCPTLSSGYSWGGLTGEALNISAPNNGGSNSATYTLRVTNSYGCFTNRQLNVIHEKSPNVSVSAMVDSVSATSVCSASLLNLAANPGTTTTCPSCNNNGLSYIWSVSSSPSVNPTLQGNGFQTVNAIPTNNTTSNGIASYTVLATNTAGCAASATQSVTVLPVWQGTMNIAPITDICHGTVITVTLSNTPGFNYTNVDYDLYDFGSFVRSHTSSSNIDTFIVVANTADTSYNFETDVILTNGCVVTLLGPGTQKIWANPAYTLMTPSSTCNNVSFTASITTPPSTSYNYTWVGGTATANNNMQQYTFAGNDSVRVTASYNPVPEITCRTRTANLVDVSSNSGIILTATPAIICNGASSTLSVAYASGTTPTQFIWSNGVTDSIITGVPGATYMVAPTVTTDYRVTMTNTLSCQSIANIRVIVNYPPSVQIVNPGSPVCPVPTVLRSTVSGGLQPYRYSWSTAPLIDTLSTLSVTPTVAGTNYTLTVRDANNCQTSMLRNIKTEACGDLQLTRNLNKLKYCKGDTIIFTANLAPNITLANPSYQWSTGATTQMITIFPPLTDQSLNVIVADGAAKFRVDSVAEETLGRGKLTAVLGATSVTYGRITGGTTGSIVPKVFTPAVGVTEIVRHPSLTTATANGLYDKSILEFNIIPIAPATSVPHISEVAFEGYRGRIINQSITTIGTSTGRKIEVQVPCYKAENSNIAVTIVAVDNQVHRTTTFLKIKQTSNHGTEGGEAITAQEPYVVTGLDPNAINLTSLSDTTSIISTPTTSQLVSVQGQEFRPTVQYNITGIATVGTLANGAYTLNAELNSYGNSSATDSVTYTKSGGTKHVFQLSDASSGSPGTRRTIVSFPVNYPGDFPITASVPAANDRGRALTNILGSVTHSFVLVTPNYTRVSTLAISSIPIVGITTTPTSHILTDITTPVPGPTIQGAFFSPSAVTGTTASVQLNFLASPTVSTGIADITSITPFTTSSTVTIDNTTYTTPVTLNFSSGVVGTTTTTTGPSYVTHVMFSDFFRDLPITNPFISTPLQTNILIPDRQLFQPIPYRGGSGGSVCLFEIGGASGKKDKVVISGTVFSNISGVNTSVGYESSFKLSVANPSITDVSSSKDTICAGGQVRLTVDTSAVMELNSYRWSATPLMSAPEISRMVSNNSRYLISAPTVTSNYVITATDVYGCSAKDSILIYVNPLPGTKIGPMVTGTRYYCPDGSITLFAETTNILCAGNCTYRWSSQQGSNWSLVGSSSTLARNYEETIRLSITANGCTDSAVTSIAKHPLPQVQIAGPVPNQITQPICSGTPITLSVVAPCSGCNYLWNTGPTFSNLTVNAPGGYYAQVTDNNGCRALSQPLLVVNSNTGNGLSVTGTPSAICQGQAAQLSTQACASCSYRWYRDDPTVIVPLQTNYLPTQRYYTTTVPGEYFTQVKNQHGCIYRSINNVVVQPLSFTQPVISSTTDSICSGRYATLTTPFVIGATYQWYYATTSASPPYLLASSTTNTITAYTTGLYYVSLTDPSGCRIGSNAKLIEPSNFTPILNASNNTICNGNFVTLATTSIPGYAYQWYLNGVSIPSAVASAYDATIAGNYYVRVTNNNGCIANTLTRTLNVSSISTPVATSDKTTFCPNDSVRLSVSLCPGCSYQWFKNGVAIDVAPSPSNYLKFVTQAGAYTVRVSTLATGCSQLSNAVVIASRNAAQPSISATITEVCNGISPILRTTSCVGCNYTWLNGTTLQPIFGALNDTIYTATSQGTYGVQVAYPNGCIVVSSQQVIINGSFSTTLTDNNGSEICNSSPITFTATLSDPSRCTGGCSYQWFRNGIPLITTAVSSYSPPINQRLGGSYQVRVITPSGCISESNLQPVAAITLAPTITASAAAICGGTPVSLTINNCPNGCNGAYTYLWSTSATTSSITVTMSASYVATVTKGAFCSATTPPIALNPLSSLGTVIGVRASNGTVTSVAVASICAGDSVRLEQIGGCSACTYQWVRGTSTVFANVPTATLNNYSTNVANGYRLIANDTSNNCRDTSNFIVLQSVPSVDSFRLNFNGATLAASGSPTDMDILGPGLTPTTLRTIGNYTSVPLFAYNPPTFNPGLSADTTILRKDIFSPASALPGNYLITYSYTQSGCVFTTSDVLIVQNAATVDIENRNPLHTSYEACVSDTIVITTTNFAFQVNSVRFFNQQDAYTTATIASVITVADTLGADIIYAQQIRLVIPDWAKGCFVRLVGTRNGGAPDSTTTQFLLIHNEPLALSGLPTTICSNGSPIALTGTPTGGTFLLQRYAANALGTNSDTAAIAGVFSGTILSPSFIPFTQYDSNGIDTMRVVYRFYSKFSNGNFCPQPDTVNSLVIGRAVTLSQVRFNPISVSQSRENLSNLVKRVTPHSASPSRWLVNAPANGHEVIYGGSFTTPAGAPLEFLPANAGVGMRTLTYTIKNGICQSTVFDDIEVLPLPSQVAVADTICRNIAPVVFGRDPSLNYQANSLQFIQPGVTFADTFNTLVVSSSDTSRYITVLNPNVGLEQFRYLPRVVDTVLIRDTLLVQYIYSRVEYNNGLPFDTTTYVIASFYQPIFIEDTTLVNILDTLLSPVICESNTDVLVAATPSGGVFSLQGGTGTYAGADSTLVNNILNTRILHSNETANTNYVLTYTLSGAACRSRDTFRFLVPKPLNATFATASTRRTYCNSALPDPIIASTTGNFTNVLLVNGVAQPTMFFTPTLTTPGPQIVINEVTDTDFGCITSFRDSFHVFPLPLVRIDTFAVREFCTNDSSFQFTIHPAPTCLGATGGERLIQGFNSQAVPAGWSFSNLNPASSGWGQRVVNTLSVAFVDTTSVNQNTWLYTAPVNMTAGSTYQIEYLMRVGPRNCQTCADATMAVTVGQGQNPLAQATVLATYPTLDDNYAGFYTMQTHSFIASANGNHHFAFHATSAGRTTRWIAIDTVIIRQISAGNCLTGIGSITGAGIVNTPGNDSLYTFAPTAMTPGVYTIRYSFSDTRGCVDSVVIPLEVKPHPSVSMSALAPTYCNNDLAVPMSGNPVGGVFTQTRLSGAAGNNMRDLVGPVNNITYNISVPLRLRPRHVGVERFEYRYRDPLTQCATSVFDTVRVVGIPDSARFLTLVNAPTNPNALRPIYCQSNPAITLNVEPVRGAPLAGFFYGAGVLNGAGGPGVAQINLDSAVLAQGRVGNDTLTYVYTTSNGCRDTTRYVVQIEPLPTLSFDLAPVAQRLPDSICLNDPSRAIRVRHQQFTGPLGTQFIDTMIIFGAGTMTASALQIGDTLNPRAFGAGYHNLSYFFRNVHGCQSTIRDSFRVDTVPVIFFTGLPASRSYCENEQGGLLLAYPAYYPGSGYLQLGTRRIDSSFVYIDPAQLANSTQTVVYPIFYTFTNLRGCTSTGRDTIEIRPYPRIIFTLDSVYCNQDDTLDLYTGVTPTGGLFTDNLAVSSIIQGRYLNLNANAGPRRINYQYTDTLTGCSNAARKTVTLYHTPSVSFITAGGCQGVDVVFEGSLSNLDANFDSLTQVIWNFGDGNSVNMTPTNPILVPDTTHTYTTNGYMQPSLTVVNRGLCSTSVQSSLVVSPTIVLDRYLAPYVEDFETTSGFWYPEQEQVASPTDTVWSHRLLTNGHITDPNNKAWVTHGAQAPYVYGLGDRAHIYSPCFDFSRTWRPMISMDVWRDMNPGVDGVVLEYYDQAARDWKVVGEQNQGVRWYQSNFLLSRPGGQRSTTQPTGWTGISEGWDNVRYRLDQFAGQPSVRFRVAFAAASNTVLIDQPQGFAFDSVWIGERGRNVLVEHFTNYRTNDVYFIEQGLYNKIYNNMYGRDVTMIQYHIEVPAFDDQYNNANIDDNAARAGFYDVQESNRGLIDGFPRGDGSTDAITIRDFDLNMLQFPSFDVFIAPLVINGNDLTVSATVLARKDMPFDEYSVMVVVTEDSLPNQTIDQNSYIYPLMGVMRKLLPDNGGQDYTGQWWQGQNLAVSHSYTMTTPIPTNPAALNGVVFVQNRRTQEVYQVATTRDLTIYAYDSLTTVVPGQPNQVQDEISSLKLYPNPANNYFNVDFEQPLNTDYQWQLVDVLGRVLQSGTAQAGSRQLQINTENLSSAPYFFTIRNNSVYTQRQVIITKP